MSAEEFSTLLLVLFLILIIIGIIAFAVYLYWRIARQMGYSGASGLLYLVPIVDICVLIYLAFGTWPITEEVHTLHEETNHLRRRKAALQQRLAEANAGS